MLCIWSEKQFTLYHGIVPCLYVPHRVQGPQVECSLIWMNHNCSTPFLYGWTVMMSPILSYCKQYCLGCPQTQIVGDNME